LAKQAVQERELQALLLKAEARATAAEAALEVSMSEAKEGRRTSEMRLQTAMADAKKASERANTAEARLQGGGPALAAGIQTGGRPASAGVQVRLGPGKRVNMKPSNLRRVELGTAQRFTMLGLGSGEAASSGLKAMLPPEPKAPASGEEEAWPFAPGSCVEIFGLDPESGGDLNGQQGIVVPDLGERERFEVQTLEGALQAARTKIADAEERLRGAEATRHRQQEEANRRVAALEEELARLKEGDTSMSPEQLAKERCAALAREKALQDKLDRQAVVLEEMEAQLRDLLAEGQADGMSEKMQRLMEKVGLGRALKAKSVWQRLYADAEGRRKRFYADAQVREEAKRQGSFVNDYVFSELKRSTLVEQLEPTGDGPPRPSLPVREIVLGLGALAAGEVRAGEASPGRPSPGRHAVDSEGSPAAAAPAVSPAMPVAVSAVAPGPPALIMEVKGLGPKRKLKHVREPGYLRPLNSSESAPVLGYHSPALSPRALRPGRGRVQQSNWRV